MLDEGPYGPRAAGAAGLSEHRVQVLAQPRERTLRTIARTSSPVAHPASASPARICAVAVRERNCAFVRAASAASEPRADAKAVAASAGLPNSM
ncbi:hypothetical protein SSBG_02809 [Streptomyces sp. SPB074]|nr:hypothetical protein SSBG_02809 [Streptomyces sp. SPB074]